MRIHPVTAAALLSLAFSGSPSAKTDNLLWDIETDRNSFTLTLRQKQASAALPFNAQCGQRGVLKLTLGAPLDKVKKTGEPVTIQLDAGTLSARISGKAHFNAFTKVYEMSVETNVKNPVFDVLAAGKPVRVTSTAKTAATWPAADGDAVRLWTTDCRYRSEH